MKKYYLNNMSRIGLAILALIATASLSSCLKDTSPGSINFGHSPALVGFQYFGFAATPIQTKVHGTAGDTTSVEVTLSVASITLGSAVTVTIAPDGADATAYVAAQNATVPAGSPPIANVVPASDYTLANGGNLTIPAGQQTAKLKINIKGNVLDFTSSPVFALKLTGASGATIASNLNVAIFTVTLQSAYEGRYTTTGSFTDVANPAFTDQGVYPEIIELQTASAFSVLFYDLEFGFGNAHPINAGGGISAYGSFDPQFNFDLSGNGKIISATNAFGQLSGSHMRSCLLDNTGVNAGTGTPGTVGYKIQVKYILYQGDIPGNRTFFTETYTYTGPI